MLSLESEYRLLTHLIKNMLEQYGEECYNEESEISKRFNKLKTDRIEIRWKILKFKKID